MSRQVKSNATQAIGVVYARLPELRTLGEVKALETLGRSLGGYGPDTRRFLAAASQYAAARGCATAGPVKVGDAWVHRSAAGLTRVWHREPTQAERRELTTTPTTSTPRSRRSVQRSQRRPVQSTQTTTARRVGRMFR